MDPAIVVTALLSLAVGVGLTLGTEHLRTERAATTQLRRLRREVVENLARIGALDGTARGFPGSIVRDAWDAAADLQLPSSVEAIVAEAYVRGAELNNRIALVDRNLTAAGGAIDFTTTAGQSADRHQTELSRQAIQTGHVAKEAFEKARDELKQII